MILFIFYNPTLEKNCHILQMSSVKKNRHPRERGDPEGNQDEVVLIVWIAPTLKSKNNC